MICRSAGTGGDALDACLAERVHCKVGPGIQNFFRAASIRAVALSSWPPAKGFQIVPCGEEGSATLLQIHFREMPVWVPPELQEPVCVKAREAGLQAHIRAVLQADMPAGPDAFLGRGSHLINELDALVADRGVSVPVRPACLIARVVACSPSKRLSP